MKRSPLRRKSKRKEAQETEWQHVRVYVLSRAGGLCEVQWSTNVCFRWATEVHHKVRRSQGGTDDPSNLLASCTPCHRTVHDNPAQARARGLLRSRTWPDDLLPGT